ncbi:hypothetical protein B8A44_07585 [Dolosigranulum pigrum]|uniref:Uncharacterized protein n=1 Tax=Dolosigranulum pigrum TaxID=29394 RepID=A0A328KKR2_9LACT|nr:hypothetical protein [Dolosigranulum pigrum]RAN62401.1 hypothetical protein B8A44_07585 [Dolosigranulum pigrum]
MIELSGAGFVFLIILIAIVALAIILPIYLHSKESINCDELQMYLFIGIVFSMMFSMFLITDIVVIRRDTRAHDTTIKTEDLSVEELRIRKEFLENKTERGKLLEDIKRLEEEKEQDS